MRPTRFIVISILLFAEYAAYAAVPSGYYYFARNKKKDALKTALHDYGAAQKLLDYGGGQGFTWEGFYYTDRNADNSVVDMYSDSVRYFDGFKAVNNMNIEHSFPKSWWGGANVSAYRDLFHLYPADDITNITKSNLPLGEVTSTPTLDNGVSKIGKNGFETSYADNCFEPADEYKGDFARSYFYISTIYQDYASLWQSPMMNNNTYPVWKKWAIDLLLKWSEQDPVSPKELARQEVVYQIQGNRNPFIDYPDLASYIWGKDTLSVYPFQEETGPFLVTPRQGTAVDFGVILQNDTKTQTLHLLGVNISSDIQVSLSGRNASLSISNPVVSASEALNGMDIGISFTPSTSGLINDTLDIQGGGIATKLRIPVKALASADFITLSPENVIPVGGTLKWIPVPQATDYLLSLYQGDKVAGDLLISAYVEGSSWNKAIEIYNGTGKTVDLSKYSVKKQSNGTGDFGSEIKLSGSLANNKSYVLVNTHCSTAGLTAKAQQLDTLVNFNGNDAVALVRSGVVIDQVGIANVGAAVVWGADLTLERKSDITHPLAVYNANEWNVLPVDSFQMLGHHVMNLASENTYILQNVSVGKTTSYAVQNLLPENKYTYSVEAVLPGGNVKAVNTMQLHTSALDVPVLMEPTAIESTRFTANWEETLYATGYQVNVFQLTGVPVATATETFDNVGTAGTPLPAGWSGTVSGNYTSTASSGANPPSVGFKSDGEWLLSKTFTQPVNKLSFMYRFATASVNSSLIVSGVSGSSVILIDSIPYKSSTAKTTMSYKLDKSKNITAVKFKYNKKGSGNMALDDVSFTYGGLDTVYIYRNMPVTSNYAVINGLTENSTYYYTVSATLGSAVSASSDVMEVQTALNSGFVENKNGTAKVYTKNRFVVVEGLNSGSFVSIYSVAGQMLYRAKTGASTVEIPVGRHGVYIVQVNDNGKVFNRKVII